MGLDVRASASLARRTQLPAPRPRPKRRTRCRRHLGTIRATRILMRRGLSAHTLAGTSTRGRRNSTAIRSRRPSRRPRIGRHRRRTGPTRRNHRMINAVLRRRRLIMAMLRSRRMITAMLRKRRAASTRVRLRVRLPTRRATTAHTRRMGRASTTRSTGMATTTEVRTARQVNLPRRAAGCGFRRGPRELAHLADRRSLGGRVERNEHPTKFRAPRLASHNRLARGEIS